MFFDKREIQVVMSTLDEEKDNISTNLYLLLSKILQLCYDQNSKFDALRLQVQSLLDLHISKQQFQDTDDLTDFLQDTIEILTFLSLREPPPPSDDADSSVNNISPILRYYLNRNNS
jgi:hypothetical protein